MAGTPDAPRGSIFNAAQLGQWTPLTSAEPAMQRFGYENSLEQKA
jgi:hypothetical protein